MWQRWQHCIDYTGLEPNRDFSWQYNDKVNREFINCVGFTVFSKEDNLLLNEVKVNITAEANFQFKLLEL